jgi:hypothetical protein
MSVNDLNHIQIIYDLVVIRIYYIDREFYVCYVDNEAIKPRMLKKAHQVRDYLTELLKYKQNINYQFFYRTDIPMTKKILINECSGWYSDISSVIYKSVLLLIE